MIKNIYNPVNGKPILGFSFVLPILLLSCFSWGKSLSAQCSSTPIPAPYKVTWEGMDNGAQDTLSNCWALNPVSAHPNSFGWRVHNYGTPSSSTGPWGDHTLGTGIGKYIYLEAANGSNGIYATLTSPTIQLDPLGAYKQLRFFTHLYGFNSSIGDLSVEIFNGSAYDTLYTITGQQNNSSQSAWNEVVLDISSYSGSVHFRFSANSKGSSGDIALDDIEVSYGTPCPIPTNPVVLSFGASSASVSWTNADPAATSWTIEYGPVGFEPGTGTSVAANSNPFTINGLYSDYNYDVTVSEDCISPSGLSSLSSSAASFKTSIRIPWYSDLSEFTNFWPSIYPHPGGDQWYREEGSWAEGGPSPYGNIINNPWGGQAFKEYGPAGSLAVYYDNTNNNINKQWVISPPIDLGSSGNTEFLVRCGMGFLRLKPANFALGDTLFMVVSTDDGATWNRSDIIHTITHADSLEKVRFDIRTISLAGYTGSIRLGFYNQSLNTVIDPSPVYPSGRFYMDDLIIRESTACPDPLALYCYSTTENSLGINWKSMGGSSFSVEYGPVGFAEGSGSLVNVTDTFANITGLSASTTYDFHIRQTCGSTDSVPRLHPITRTTACTAVDGFTYDFEYSSNVLPDCIQKVGYHSNIFKTSISIPSVNLVDRTLAASANAADKRAPTVFSLPNISNSADTTQRLFFTASTGWSATPFLVNIGYVTDLEDENSFVTLNQVNVDVANNFREYTVVLSDPIPLGGQLAMAIDTSFSGNNLTLHLGEIRWEPNPTCPEVKNLNAIALDPNSIYINWQARGTETLWDLHIVHEDSSLTTAISLLATDTFYTATNLNFGEKYYVYVRGICGAGDSSIMVMDSISLDYCISAANTTDDGYIAHLVVEGDTITKNTGNCVSYSDYTALTPIDIYYAGSPSFDIGYASCLNNATSVCKVFIDFNNDLFFDPTTELVGSGVLSSGNPLLFAGQLPSSGPIGTRQMRVVMRHGTSSVYQINACSSFTSGETQDYTVNMMPPLCAKPSNVFAETTGGSSALVTWTPGSSTSSEWFVVGLNFSNISASQLVAATNDSVEFTNLVSGDQYFFIVAEICASGDTSDVSDYTPRYEYVVPYAPDYIETFDSWFITGNWEWARGDISNPSNLVIGWADWRTSPFANQNTSDAAHLNLVDSTQNEWLMTPSIFIPDNGIAYELNFDISMTEAGDSNLAAIMGSDDSLMIVISYDDGLTWNRSDIIYSIHQGNKPNDISWSVQHWLQGYTGRIKVGIYAESTVANEDIDIHIDNFEIRANCALPPVEITNVSFVSAPAQHNAQFTSMAGNRYILQTREVGTSNWFLRQSWKNPNTTSMNFTAKKPGVENEVRIGAKINGVFVYSCPVPYNAPCKPMSVNAIELVSAFCAGDSALLKGVFNGGVGSKSFRWNTGETTRLIYGQQGQSYTYIVTDAVGCTDSASVTVSSLITDYTPVNFVATKPNAVTFTGNWDAISLGAGVSLVGYRMAYRQVNVGATWNTTPLSSNTTATVDFTASGRPTANYEFTVFARVNDNGTIYNTEYACSQRLFYNGSGAKADLSSASKLARMYVFPNPTSNYVNVQTPVGESGSIEIMDATGRVVYSMDDTQSGTIQIDMSNWSKGVYILRSQGFSVDTTERIIKN